jgi:hypothetical protein
MNAKKFVAVSVTVLAPVGQEDGIENDLVNLTGNVGLYTFGSTIKPLSRNQWREVKSQVPEEILENE